MTRSFIAVGLVCFGLGVAAVAPGEWPGGAASLRNMLAGRDVEPAAAKKREQTGDGAKVKVALTDPDLPPASTWASGSRANGNRWEFVSYGTPTDALSLSVAVWWDRGGASGADLVAGIRGLKIFEAYEITMGERVALPAVPDLPLRAIRFDLDAQGLTRRCIGFDGHGGPRGNYVRGYACGALAPSRAWLSCTLHTLTLDGHLVAGPEGCTLASDDADNAAGDGAA